MASTIKPPPETLSTEAPESPRNGIIPFIKRHAVSTYYALAFAISWAGIVLTMGPDGMFSTGATQGHCVVVNVLVSMAIA